MLNRSKLFLTFLALCLAPLVLLALLNYWTGSRAAEFALQNNLEADLANFNENLTHQLREDQHVLIGLSQSNTLKDYLLTNQSKDSKPSSLANGELQLRLSSLVNGRSNFANISLFDKQRRQLFAAEPSEADAHLPYAIHTSDFPAAQARPDERVWNVRASSVFNSADFVAPKGALLNYTVPVFPVDQKTGVPEGALVGALKLDPVLSNAGRAASLFNLDARSNNTNEPQNILIVLEHSGRILYHSNGALNHQLVSDSMPYFLPVARQIFTSEKGQSSFISPAGKRYRAAYVTIPGLDLSVVAARNYDEALAPARRVGGLGIVFAVLLGFMGAMLLTASFQRKTRGIERLREGVEAIAKGQLDHRIELRSSDDLRPLADNVGLMTKQLREQIAREAESKQFQSFVRLSAVLTHDLKNAIEALSLIVSNMDRHFDNEAFRADAMRSLTGATRKLKSLVDRLSNPVTTLSGEYKRPRPADLVPMLKKAISMVAEPVRETHRIEVQLSEPVLALIDSERIEKVVENLILNALEAMGDTPGTLTIAAGIADGKAFFSISDTGPGMSRRFIEERLFHPFATTKKKGVGLGLYTCREVVRANGGTIEVESREGSGTTFRVVLPSAATR